MLIKFKEEEGMSLVELIVIISVLGFLMVVGFTKINEIVGGANEVVNKGNHYMEGINDLTGDIDDHIAGIDRGSGLVEDSTPEGEGAEEDPFKIANYTDLTLIGEDDYPLNAHYELIANINASSSHNLEMGADPIGTFAGTFDGKGHVIRILYINRPNMDSIGMFSSITAIIKNVGMIDSNIIGKNKVGGLVAYQRIYSTIQDSYVEGGIIKGNNMVGGLVGDISSTTTTSIQARLNHSYAAVKVEGETNVGGLVGDSGSLITNNIYWDKEVSGQETSSTGTGKTTEEMKERETFDRGYYT